MSKKYAMVSEIRSFGLTSAKHRTNNNFANAVGFRRVAPDDVNFTILLDMQADLTVLGLCFLVHHSGGSIFHSGRKSKVCQVLITNKVSY